MRWARCLGVVALVWLLGGCAVPLATDNQPLPMLPDGKPDFDSNYGLARYVKNVAANMPNAADDAGSDVLLFVTFSGGGKRSAAFGHGALRGLRDVPLHRPDGTTVNLLNALDYLSGVSGGSFPAAHYGLFRDKSFDTFRSDFLDVDINSYIWGIYLLPWHWGWLVNPLVGTNDYMAQVYDRLMFHGATYEDLAKVGRPIVSIDATDITNGATFPILGTNFGLICSDLNSFPIARAVAASNGFPGLFSPITLRSYARAVPRAEAVPGRRPLCNGARNQVGRRPPKPVGASARHLRQSGTDAICPPDGRRHRRQSRAAGPVELLHRV